MPIPVITPGTITREEAITNLIESVAQQESALSSVIYAEHEKMQTIINMQGITSEQLLQLNTSVQKMINVITQLEMMFQAKLELFSSELSSASQTVTV